jgi:hypothetical protein
VRVREQGAGAELDDDAAGVGEGVSAGHAKWREAASAPAAACMQSRQVQGKTCGCRFAMSARVGSGATVWA